MTRSHRSLSLLATASVLLATILVVGSPLASSSAAAAPLPEIYNAGSDEHGPEGTADSFGRVFLRFGRSGDLSAASSVRLTLIDGTAKRGTDYTARAYTTILKFPAGEDLVWFFVNVKSDTVVEPDETFSWRLSNPVGATIRDGSADGSVVIVDDDSAEPTTFSVGNAHYTAEDNLWPQPAEFIVTRSGSTATASWVKFSTVAGSARAPGDYAAKRTTLYFGVGETFKQVYVPITNDLVPEPEETFAVQLSAPVHATITDDTGIATIIDDDSSATPELSIEDDFTYEGDGYSHQMTITIRRDEDLRGTSTVRFATSDGTAHAPGDYLGKSGTVTFRPGDVYRRFTVAIKGDRVVDLDPHKYFVVTLSDPSAGTVIADSVGEVYIDDDDY